MNEQTVAAPSKKTKQKMSKGSVIFYAIYVAIIVCVVAGLLIAMGPLEDWLTRYEESQPEHARDEIFATLFADPDWDLIYDLAGVQDTQYEGKEEFVAYMENKVAGKTLTCQETSAGLSGGKKYFVKLDSEKIAAFTITSAKDSAFDVWQLSQVEVFFTREESVSVITMPGYTVYINGLPLDDSFTTMTVCTIAEDYMPNGEHGYRYIRQEASGFLLTPEIVVKDENGTAVEVTYDASNGVYTTYLANTAPMTEQFASIALAAAQANAKYAIRAISAGKLREHFDPNCQVYQDISSTPVFLQSYKSYSFDDTVTQVTDFYQYSDSFFSARVVLKMDIVRKDGTTKTYEMDTTYFFTKNSAGNWLVTDMTNVHVQELVTAVRLRYIHNEEVILSEMVESDIDFIYLPSIEVPAGQTLVGWAVQETDEEGNITYNIVLEANDTGVIRLPDDQILEPMTLYPVFEAAK
jgi:hypothetical protein